MKRIGITQRNDFISDRDECRDSIDQSWTLFFEKLGLDIVLVPNRLNDLLGWVDRQSIKGFVLSGGSDIESWGMTNSQINPRDHTEQTLLRLAQIKALPVLGICRGMQMMNKFLGGRISPVNRHASGPHNVTSMPDNLIFQNYKTVNSFHNWGIYETDLAANLKSLAFADDLTVEACSHEELPWYGIMWHPERDNGDNATHDSNLVSTIFLED